MENSSKIKNILYQNPKWILKYGNIFIFSVLAGLIILSYLIKEPDTVKVKGSFIKNVQIEEIRALKEGEISKIFYSENETVAPDALIATLNGKGDFESVQQLAKRISAVLIQLNSKNYQLDSLLLQNRYKNLGEMQVYYEEYLDKYRLFKNSWQSGIENQRKAMNLKNKYTLTQEQRALENQLKILQEKIALKKKDYETFQNLYNQKIISASALRMRKEEYLNIENERSQLEIRVLNNQQLIDGKQYDILEVDDKIRASESTFLNATMSLFNELDIWLDAHSLKAKYGGKLIFHKNVKPNYFVSTNETVFFTDPSITDEDYSVELHLGITSLGKIKEGNIVKLSVPAYPYQEFGFLTAKISYLPEVAIGDTSYRAKAELVGTIKNMTSLRKKIALKHGLYTDAHIIVKDRSLLAKLFQNFRKEY